jgi:NADH-quinone oxidoreductase subunit G
MAEDQTITIEVDGKQLSAKPGQMLIEVTDAAGITVPRFCYHKKLSVAANCRMCLVEVEKAPKPLPACATPVMDGMKVFTRSPLAREAQQGTMEFLLINHPLDCPICDQGGECELQDVAMGYGADVSRYTERKRVVKDEDIGPLIATEMTRCIHCTRCVRFGGEIAGLRELGATGRGEHMRIGLFVEHAVASELSGNVIDLCPVGALTAKPSRFEARAWELSQHSGISPHDGVGANLYLHVRRNGVMRAVPRENEAVNETWIADRDRFGYQGLHSEDRLTVPMMREGGELKPVDWQVALRAAATALKQAGRSLGTLISPSSSLEEAYLAQKLTRALGSNHIDHRLRQSDFRDAAADPVLPWLGQTFANLSTSRATLLIGSWLRKDQPLLNHRLRQSVINGGAVMAVNPVAYDFNYVLAGQVVVAPSELAAGLAGIAAALGADTAGIQVEPDAEQRAIAERLKTADGQGSVLLGVVAHSHPDFALLRRLAANISDQTGLALGFLPDGGNATGAWLAGAVPHRGPGGAVVSEPGLDAMGILSGNCKTLLLLGVEPEFDTANPALMQSALTASDQVIALASFRSPWLDAHADILLPIGSFGESGGTLVNLQGDRQGYSGVVNPPGETRPAWKVLRVLGNLADVEGFDYLGHDEVRDELLAAAGDISLSNAMPAGESLTRELEKPAGIQRIGGVAMYSVDALVRRATALQRTPDAWTGDARLSSKLAATLGLANGDSAMLQQAGRALSVTVRLDDRVPDDCVWLPAGVPGSENLAGGFGEVSLAKA